MMHGYISQLYGHPGASSFSCLNLNINSVIFWKACNESKLAVQNEILPSDQL